MFRYPVVPAALLLLAGCQPMAASAPTAAVIVTEEEGWRRLAAPGDEERLAGVAQAWEDALGRARGAGFRRQVDREGDLLEPDAALPRPAPSPGTYRCRLIRFGLAGRERFTAFQPFFCHVGVDANQLSITKQTGSERPSGYLWEDGEEPHLVFLGSLALGGDEAPLAYGDDPERDMIGLLERVGPLRFRLVIPKPRNGSTLEVIELVPAENQPEG